MDLSKSKIYTNYKNSLCYILQIYDVEKKNIYAGNLNSKLISVLWDKKEYAKKMITNKIKDFA